jgi:tetratricopeptide (TPR) repeat protein
MRRTVLVVLSLIAGSPAGAEPRNPYDAFSYEVVVPTPADSDLRITRDMVYARGAGGPLKLDVYLPRSSGKQKPPAVVFANIVGERGSRPFRATEIYRSWARLLAAHGIAGVIIDSEAARAGENLGQSIDHLRKNGAALGIDGDRLGVWACSANVSIALPYLMAAAPEAVRTAIIYYGSADVSRIRTELPLLYVMASDDAPELIANQRKIWDLARAAGAPWTTVVARGLPHAFDALDESEPSRRLVLQTVDYLVRQLERLPAGPVPSKARRYMQAVYGRRTAEAIPLLRSRLAEAPDDVQARSELGRMLLMSGDRAGAIQTYEVLVARSDLPTRNRSTALYNLACAHALEGHKDAALGRLEEAVAAGFTSASEISSDPDLESLRQDPRYRALMERLGAARPRDASR